MVLAVVGLAILLAGWLLYPSSAGNPTPGYSELILQSAVPVNYIQYGVNRVSAGSASISVSVVFLAKTAVPARAAKLAVYLPIGDTFAHCHGGGCHVLATGQQETSYWVQALTFRPSSSGPAATVDFAVKAADFGATFDGVDASAAIPEVRYCCAAKVLPVLQAGYPSAQPANMTGPPTSRRHHQPLRGLAGTTRHRRHAQPRRGWHRPRRAGAQPARVAPRRDPARARWRSTPVRCPGSPARARLNCAARGLAQSVRCAGHSLGGAA